MSQLALFVKHSKKCTGCGVEKDLSMFSKSSMHAGGVRNTCRECESDRYRSWKKNNKEASDRLIALGNASRKKRIQENRAIIRDLKNAPCQDCGKIYPACAMDYDHRDGEVKKLDPSQYQWSIGYLLAEIAKCDLVCANCHRVRTHLRRILQIQKKLKASGMDPSAVFRGEY